MMRPIVTRSACLLIPSLALVAGCNTDQMWSQGRTNQRLLAPRRASSNEKTPDIQVAGAKEVDLVEQVLYHRDVYRKSLTALRDYYRERGYDSKRRWAQEELADLDKVRPFRYILDAEIPAPSLKPLHAIADADEYYRRGLDLMKKGGHGVPALYRQDLMEEALQVFVELITKYPTSDKIDDAAFLCGEIHKEYFQNHEPIAVEWYKRAYTWDAQTPHPARFQAAVVYDFRLHDRAKALELYHEVVSAKNQNKSNAAFASRRIYELTEGVDQIHAPRPPMEGAMQASQPPDMFGAQQSSPAQSGSGAGNERADMSDASVSDDELVPVVNLGPDEE